jgi:predicted transcriptional regulator
MKRIEIHLTEDETETLDQIASDDGRSRKNLCETEIRKLIERWQKNKATDNAPTLNWLP